MLLLGGLELQFVHLLNNVAEIVARRYTVSYFAKHHTDFCLDACVGRTCKAFQVRKQLAVDKLNQVVPDKGVMHVVIARGRARHRPIVPAIALGNDGRIVLVLQCRLHLASLLEVVEIFEE